MKRFLTFVLLSTFFAMSLPTIAMADPEPAIRVTPKPPVFTDAERQAELAKRRAAVAAKMTPGSMLIMWAAQPRNYAGDVDFYYRQENNYYYLTALKQTNSALVMVKEGSGVKEYLFLPKRNPQFETWNGHMYSGEEATKISGIKTIIDATELAAFQDALNKKTDFMSKSGVAIATNPETIYLLLPESEQDREGVAEFNREDAFKNKLPVVEGASLYKTANARPIFEDLRLIKSPYEIKLMQHAVDISIEAHMRSQAMAGRADWEYQVQAEVEYTFRRRNADYWGYPSIVGCGPNATTLHYEESQSSVKKGELLLMDVGAEYDHYTADVTRTFPVSGKFTKEQAEIYQIVYDAQEAAAAAAAKPGATMGDLGRAAQGVIMDGLFKLGLISARDPRQVRMWYMHGLGHWIGMNVHDVGTYQRPLKPGMMFTNEPGIYIRQDALDYLSDTPENKAMIAKIKPAFEKYKNIGVRIEDDLLITENGVVWMTKALPRSIADIEAFMAKASKELPYTARGASGQNIFTRAASN